MMDGVIAHKELVRIGERHGGLLRPEQVVEAARPRNSVLHDYFEWDDTKAAEQHRLEQARRLIRVTVTMIEIGGPTPIRAFVSLSTDRKHGGGYRPTLRVLGEAPLAEQMMRDALADLRAIESKYRNLAALAPVFRAVAEVARKIGVRPAA